VDLAVDRDVEVLTGLDVATDHAPLAGRAGSVLVAVLEQDVATRIDEEHDGDTRHRCPP
jgi:hypothetical protein